MTLGDEAAKRRGVQKSVLERAAPPTFDVCVEMVERHRWRVHEDVGAAVDAILAGAAWRISLGASAYTCIRRMLQTNNKDSSSCCMSKFLPPDIPRPTNTGATFSSPLSVLRVGREASAQMRDRDPVTGEIRDITFKGVIRKVIN